MNQSLFEVAVIQRAGLAAQQEGKQDTIVVEPKSVLASSVENAILLAGAANADAIAKAGAPALLSVCVRQFTC